MEPLFAVLLVFLFTLPTHSCDCPKSTFETRYCSSSNSFAARVKNETFFCFGVPCEKPVGALFSTVYGLKILRVFKGKLSSKDDIAVTPLPTDGVCAFTLKVGSKYLFNTGPEVQRSSGNEKKGSAVPDIALAIPITICDGIRSWPVSRSEERFIRKNSKTNGRLCAKRNV